MSNLLDLSPDIIQRILVSVKTINLLQMASQSSIIAELTNSSSVWRNKMVTVKSAREAILILSQPNLHRHIRHLDLSNSYLEELLMHNLIDSCVELHSLQLKCLETQIGDEFIERVTQRHGQTLKSLSLDRSYHLTNFTIEAISAHCCILERLDLYACMFSNAAILELARSNLVASLRHLNIGRCHLINISKIRIELTRFTQLQILNISYNDSVEPVQLCELVKRLPRLRSLDVTDCVEICRKDVAIVQRLRSNVQVMHSSKLDDYSPASIRSYLLSLEAAVIRS